LLKNIEARIQDGKEYISTKLRSEQILKN